MGHIKSITKQGRCRYGTQPKSQQSFGSVSRGYGWGAESAGPDTFFKEAFAEGARVLRGEDADAAEGGGIRIQLVQRVVHAWGIQDFDEHTG
ncbi:hypothetical protein TRIP_E300108 [uncultured Spirochaetota bacterium]|nr:hypothetical protein TRIP_E300108 [uncultured Spirochaetota bacterium]